ncbi:MAG: CcmD family protein [Candidatus Poribacteria bacterium]|nr:CcmD family protein [Candidatus Poribacteria bacterium]
MRIVIVLSCLIVIGLSFLAIQVPIIDIAKVEEAINDVKSISQVNIADEETLKKTVNLIVKELESDQRTRLKYLVSAYLVIWLVFMLYLLRLGRQQQALDQRLTQLEQETSDSQTDP